MGGAGNHQRDGARVLREMMRAPHRRWRRPWWRHRIVMALGILAVLAVASAVERQVPANWLQGWSTSTLKRQEAVSPLVGRASVIDGDTVEIAGQRVRFNGVDAPEARQLCEDASGREYACGRVATQALDAWLAQSRPLTCNFVERDRHGRFVGDCYRADGASVASWLVRSGHAMDWPRHSGGAYHAEQADAWEHRRGIWQGKVVPPWEWRAGRMEASRSLPGDDAASFLPSAPSSGSCDIKGNISSNGERIYHVPGQRHYNDTRIDTGRGERWFCSEAEAMAAGWRKARR